MNFFRIYFYAYIMMSFSLFSCDFFSTPQVPKDAEGVFQDIIKNLKLSQSLSDCSFFDTRTRSSLGETRSSRSYEKNFSQEYNKFWENSRDVPEQLKETFSEKHTVSQSGYYKIIRFDNEHSIVYKYQNYGLKLIGITGVIVGTEIDRSKGTMNIQGILEVSGFYHARIEIRNLKINNKNDHSNCAKVASLENQSDSEKWSIIIRYEHPKTKQEMGVGFNEGNKEQKRILLESLLQKKEHRRNKFNF